MFSSVFQDKPTFVIVYENVYGNLKIVCDYIKKKKKKTERADYNAWNSKITIGFDTVPLIKLKILSARGPYC